MEIKEALNWLYTIINRPEACHGNLKDNNEALDIICDDLEVLDLLRKVLIVMSQPDVKRINGELEKIEVYSQVATKFVPPDILSQSELKRIKDCLEGKSKE